MQGQVDTQCVVEGRDEFVQEHFQNLHQSGNHADEGENIAVREFRGLAPHYLRGTSGAAKLRGAISQASTLAEIEALLQLDKA